MPNFHALQVVSVRRETADAISVVFGVPEALRSEYTFIPGQYLTLRAMIDGQDVRRSYSICSGPHEPLRVGIKQIPGGLFSNWAASVLRAGDWLQVMTPDGRFGLPAEAGASRVLAGFAAGSGITPILAIMKAVLEQETGSRFLLYYGNRTTGDILFRQEIEDLKDRHMARLSVFHVLSREQQDVAVLNGHLDAEKLAPILRTLPLPDHIFVCGPQPMIEDLVGALGDGGIPADRVHVERFTRSTGGTAYVAPAVVPDRTVSLVTVIHAGGRTDIPVGEGEAIIDAAIRAGRDLPFSCKGGMCCTCRAKVLEGEVAMVVNYSLEPWETALGFVLTCQARPLTARVVVDFDAV